MGIFKYTATALTLALSLAATAPASAQEKKTYHVGAAVYGLKGEFMQLWANSLKEHPLVKDGTVKVTIYDGKYDALTQNNQFDTMITQKMDGILFVAIDAQAGAEAVNKAYAAKIPVVGSNTRVKTDKLTSYVGSNDVIAGEMEAESVIKAMGGKGNVVILEGPIGQSAQIERRKGNENVLAKYKDVKVLEMKTANWSRAEALSLMENWLTAHSGKINGIIGQNAGRHRGGEGQGHRSQDHSDGRHRRREGRRACRQGRQHGQRAAGCQGPGPGFARRADARRDRCQLQATFADLGALQVRRSELGRRHGQGLQHSLDADHHAKRRRHAGRQLKQKT